MTLVLPFGVDQISSNSLYSSSGSNQNSTMPCVFDNDSFERDFESALMRDWSSDITDYDMPAEDSPIKTPSDSIKRKSSDENEVESQSKKTRFESSVPPLSSDLVSSSSSTDDLCRSGYSSVSPFLESSSRPTTVDSSTSTSANASTSTESHDDDSSVVEVEEDDYMPRRRPYQMWTSRQRLKDERKKVLKMSATKLAEIDDPELCLLRSVLINNTIKKLNADIRNEKEARLRLKQQKMDLFAERYAIASNSVDNTEHLSSSSSNFNSSSNEVAKPNSTANTSDFYDESSCDEIFGLTEDFLRVPTPDRRVSSPIPTTNSHSSRNTDNQQQHQESMDTSEPLSDITTSNVTCYSSSNSFLPSCNTDIDCSSSFYQRRTTQNNNSSSNKQTVNNITAFPSAVPSSSSLKQFLVSVSSASNGGSQCATQYRTNRDVVGGSGSGESFPPRVPILDEVVYHSLLASMNT